MGPRSIVVSATPMAAPTDVTATGGDRQVTLGWLASPDASSYTVYRSTSSSADSLVVLATGVAGLSFVSSDLTNGTRYYYRVRAIADGGVSALSAKAHATPQPPPPATAPANLMAVAGNARVTLAWEPVAGATRYRLFRSTTGVWDTRPLVTLTTLTFKNSGLINGTAYSYKVVGNNPGGDGPASAVVTATPMAPPATPAGVYAVAGNGEVTLNWTPAQDATRFNVYRGTSPNRQATVPVASGVAGPPFVDRVANGPTYFYKVTALNAGGESPRSTEVYASPEGLASPSTVATRSSCRVPLPRA